MAQYPFIQARYYTRGGLIEARAVLWHMAEGAGTVSWLTHPDQNVSAGFVIELDGDIVQMVRDGDASHSAHVAIDPDDVDASTCGGLYDDAIARAVLGTGWADINAYVVSVEVEGWRRLGPNAQQREAIVELGHELRVRHPTIRGNLGHRDVQDYKSCPGCRFPWDAIGGHGLLSGASEGSPMAIQAAAGLESSYVVDVRPGLDFFEDAALQTRYGEVTTAATVPYIGPGVGGASRAIVLVTGVPYGDKVPRPTVVFVRSAAVVPVAVPPPTPADCDAAIELDRTRAYIAYR